MTDSIRITTRHFQMHPPGSFRGFADRNFDLPVATTALVAVDIYGTPAPITEESYSGMLAQGSTDTALDVIEKRIAPALEAARNRGLPVVYVANSAPRIALGRSAYAEQKWESQRVDKDVIYREDSVDPHEYHRGETGVLRYLPAVAPKPDDYFVRKHTHSGFFDTRLDTLLRNLGVRTIVFVGFALDVCLGATMMDALWRNYRVLLLRDCTYAIEIPGIDEPGTWTSRWITFVESTLGYTATSEQFIDACRHTADVTPAADPAEAR